MSEIYTRGIMIGYHVEREISSGLSVSEVREKPLSLSEPFTKITAALPTLFDKGTKALEIFIDGSDDLIRINQPWTFEEWKTNRKMLNSRSRLCYRPAEIAVDDMRRYNSYLRTFYRKAGEAVKYFVKGHKKLEAV